MEQNSQKAGSDYEIGFGKPPKHGQFKKGESGNPKGRPRKLIPFQEMLYEELQEKVPVNGKMITKQRVIIKALVHDSMKGKPRAQATLLPFLMQIGNDEIPEELDANEEDIKALKALMENFDRSVGS